MKIFVAGATGALGRPLIKRLLAAGVETYGLASKPASAALMASMGATPISGNALDRESLFDALRDVRPDVVIDQLTSLPSDPAEMPERLPFDRQLRLEGGGNLFAAAEAFGVRRYIQQSSGFYLDGEGQLATEASALRIAAPGHIGQSAKMYAELERRVLGARSMEGVALRYGFFYGPGTWYWNKGPLCERIRTAPSPIFGAGSSKFSLVHVDDAAMATVSALCAPSGVYNIVDDYPLEVTKFIAALSKWLGGPPPQRIGASEALKTMGAEALYYHNELSGADNRMSKKALSCEFRHNPWLAS
ncbi:NAD(P)-dependent oxidoreductase [Asaia siamensis]|uniref:dTDP-glucose 4,6-dehydratase n=1 Tax=Asaia siamensis TaxID=110479 RepID=A0ABQ1M142_9PROT|nr:NAD(P)-dependent oxidoreductase [Asaia siamensis]GBR10085.1 nucleoside-diphosphate-sugar epimerase [Asaia siamensis NRIC 0323]GGC32558.1 dTDP-glucose 4,6-dehydratase [Asaia siamensis]